MKQEKGDRQRRKTNKSGKVGGEQRWKERRMPISCRKEEEGRNEGRGKENSKRRKERN